MIMAVGSDGERLGGAGRLEAFFASFESVRASADAGAIISRALAECARISNPLVRSVQDAARWIANVAGRTLTGEALDFAADEVGRVLLRSECPWILGDRELLTALELDRALRLLTTFPGQRLTDTDLDELRDGLKILRSWVDAAIHEVRRARTAFGLKLLCDLAEIRSQPSVDLDSAPCLHLADRAGFLAGDAAAYLADHEERLPDGFMTDDSESAKRDLALVRYLWNEIALWLRDALLTETAPIRGVATREVARQV